MNLPCDMVRDLLPLYHDNVCSETSKTLVTEHLKTCSGCTQTLKALKLEMQMPSLEIDEAKPLKRIRKTVQKRTRRSAIALGIALFLAAFCGWFWLTQDCAVPIAAEDYTIKNVVQFENGMVYLEYSHPYQGISICANIHRTESGELHFVEYRPRMGKKQEDSTIRSYLIDPQRDALCSDTGKEVPFAAFYLGCPDEGEAVPLWSADMSIPLATPEEEQLYLYNQISNW